MLLPLRTLKPDLHLNLHDPNDLPKQHLQRNIISKMVQLINNPIKIVQHPKTKTSLKWYLPNILTIAVQFRDKIKIQIYNSTPNINS